MIEFYLNFSRLILLFAEADIWQFDKTPRMLCENVGNFQEITYSDGNIIIDKDESGVDAG